MQKTAPTIAALMVVLVLAFVALAPRAEAGIGSQRWTVRLYAGTQVVASWTALDAGRVDGDSLVFHVESGMDDGTVRISGTYSVEPARR